MGPAMSPSTTEKEPAVPTTAIVGEKVGMTQIWDDKNRAIAVTVVRVSPARVVQLKTPDNDGYSAVQVTYGARQARTLTKPEAGHFAKAQVDPGVTWSSFVSTIPASTPWARRSPSTSSPPATGST